jgi:Uma2 family endonuclease
MATVPYVSDQRVVLHDVSWETYERLLADHLDCSAPRFTYDRGTLEILSPLPEHEESNRAIALLVEVIAEEWELDIRNLGSTTFKREDLERGFEPDSCFYIQSAASIRGKTSIDLTVDPPPDLVIEIDITHSSLNKLPIYAVLGIPEVWRYDGQRLSILVLEGGAYREQSGSTALPGLAAAALTDRLAESRSLPRPAWLRQLREWARVLNAADPGDGASPDSRSE